MASKKPVGLFYSAEIYAGQTTQPYAMSFKTRAWCVVRAGSV